MSGKTTLCLSILAVLLTRPAAAICTTDEWKPGGTPAPASRISAFATYHGDLIAAQESSLARWDGTGWQTLAAWDSGAIEELLEYKGELIAGGDFTTGDGVHRHIARWNGQAWGPLSDGTDDAVDALVEYHGDLIAAGRFLNAGGASCKHVARWDGNAWLALGGGIDLEVCDLIVFNDTLFAAGAGGIQGWDNSAWMSLTSPLGMNALAVYDNQLIAGGDDGLFHWANNDTWAAFPQWPGGKVSFLAVHGGTLLAVTDGSDWTPPKHIRRWTGPPWYTDWEADTCVRALASHHGELFVGGDFTTLGSTPANFCARYGPAGFSITQGPLSVQVSAGEVATLSAAASSAHGGLSYIWRKNGLAVGACTGRVSGCTGQTLTLDPALPQDAGTWEVEVSSGGCSLTSNAVRLTILPDSNPPAVAITSPTRDAVYTTSSISIDLAGTATDRVSVASVTWANDRGGSGTCVGTTNWSAVGIPLQPGLNIITTVAHDTSGNQTTTSLTVTKECTSWYADADGDGYGDLAVNLQACTPPSGHVLNSTDCDDTSASVHPGAVEVPGDGVDQNCDGADLPDGDHDGVPDSADSCPDTPEGVEVNAQGCSLSQDGAPPPDGDADGDGIADTEDGCPDDPGKTEPGACGCGQSETPNCSQPPPPGLCGAGMATATACSMASLGLALLRRKGRTS